MSKNILRLFGWAGLAASALVACLAFFLESFYLMLAAWPLFVAGYEMLVWSDPDWGLGLSDSMARLGIEAILGGIIWFGLLSIMPLGAVFIMQGVALVCVSVLMAGIEKSRGDKP